MGLTRSRRRSSRTIAISMYEMTNVYGDLGFWYMARSRMLLGVGLPLIFVPIMAASYEGIPQSKTVRRLAFFRFLGAHWPPVEDPALEVDIAGTGNALERRAADRAGARAGIERHEDKARDVCPRSPAGRLSFLNLAIAPGAPDQCSGLTAGQPAIARLLFLRQRHAD